MSELWVGIGVVGVAVSRDLGPRRVTAGSARGGATLVATPLHWDGTPGHATPRSAPPHKARQSVNQSHRGVRPCLALPGPASTTHGLAAVRCLRCRGGHADPRLQSAQARQLGPKGRRASLLRPAPPPDGMFGLPQQPYASGLSTRPLPKRGQAGAQPRQTPVWRWQPGAYLAVVGKGK